ncbi:MAG: Phosphatidylglycerol lysyltransferase [Thermocaproicibacter melissae]|jgi:glycosyltransferase 2 family protein|uniref:lysylphosphatidylglycerol synthase transmembrane domain-containing protein n=1 Tax=Thermocaproicibacter melissae TaxID=2966552 RepID=UPI0024B0B8B3|nr:lysylphosphatidylglycerol synthase transmembrane domain-containing protein [Thermocaproicibacter melissae]WBY64950.1 lysylphosphatidylglycerol synthase transmembrane domain-containing protein [Thermocaproicibacter melissae]
MPTSQRKKISAKTFFNIFSIVLTVGCLSYFAFSENGLTTLAEHVHQFKIEWLIFAVLCMLSDLFLDTCLIYLFTKGISNSYTFRRAFKVCMVGHLYSAITPFQSGGQPMQIYVMTKQKIDAGNAASTLVQKFFVYQTSITAYSMFALIFQYGKEINLLSPIMVALTIFGFIVQGTAAGFLLVVSFNQKITNKLLVWATKFLSKIHLVKNYEKTLESWQVQLDSFHESNQYLYRNKSLLIKTYILTFFQLTSLFAVFYCIYRSFGFNKASPVSMIFSQAFVTMVSSLIPLPGAAGASELSSYVFMNPFFTPETVKPAVLLWRIITYPAVILISAPFSKIKSEM